MVNLTNFEGNMAKKAFLSPPGQGTALTTWLPVEAIPRLEALAMRRGISRSTLTRMLILDYLEASDSKNPAA